MKKRECNVCQYEGNEDEFVEDEEGLFCRDCWENQKTKNDNIL